MRYVTKTALAAIKKTGEDSVIVSLKSSNGPACLYFESIDKFAGAVKKRQIRAKRWIVSVPDSLCITKTIELPAEGLEQAYKMLEFELSTYLPLPAEELVYGCVPLGRNENLLKLRVYILKIKTIDGFLERFKSIGIKPSILSVKDGRLQRYENISFPVGVIEGKRETTTDQINYLVAEISPDRQPVLKIAAANNIRDKIKNWFAADFSNIEFLEPPGLRSFDKGNLTGKNCIYESVITQGLVGSAEDADLKFLNLLGGKTLNTARRRELVINSAVTALFGILAVFCLWLNFAVANWRIHHACRKITRQIAPIEHIAADVESKRQKLKAIQTQLSNRDQITEIFSQFYKYSPKQIAISQMSYSSKIDSASVNIKGQADTLSRAFEYSDAMKDSSLLNNIQIINAQQIPRPGGSIVEFKADCSMKASP